MMKIKVLGPGCKNCAKLENETRAAVRDLGIEAQIEKVTDYGLIMQYNVLATPGLVINERVVSSGRIPAQREIVSWLADAQALEAA